MPEEDNPQSPRDKTYTSCVGIYVPAFYWRLFAPNLLWFRTMENLPHNARDWIAYALMVGLLLGYVLVVLFG